MIRLVTTERKDLIIFVHDCGFPFIKVDGKVEPLDYICVCEYFTLIRGLNSYISTTIITANHLALGLKFVFKFVDFWKKSILYKPGNPYLQPFIINKNHVYNGYGFTYQDREDMAIEYFQKDNDEMVIEVNPMERRDNEIII